jgi:formate dehydrogenase subunit delta
MMSTTERLAYMADHIARNFASRGAEAAIIATADHLATFWDPRSKVLAFGLLDGPRPAFVTDAAEAALRQLRDRGAPDSQTAATVFNHATEGGHSDAG